MKKIICYTDGGSRGNPGSAGSGAVCFLNSEKLFEIKKPLGIQTNNFAEYEAVILTLQKLLKENLHNEIVEIKADSKLVVEQLSGNWKVKNENIKPQFCKANELLNKFLNVSFIHIPREENKLADALANKAMDEG